jgi:adenine-specific DNA-methyltransferase
VRVCDTLRGAPPAEPFDLVIGNPPYGRVRLDASERKRFERSLFGHANAYGLFTDAAIALTKPGGVIAYVTPASFLAGEYFKNLRSLLGREAPPASIDFVSARGGVFDGVLQETLLATYRRGASAGPVVISTLQPVDETALAVEAIGLASLPPEASSPWIVPRHRDHMRLAAALATMPHRLADWGYTVSTGPLVWNRYKDQLAHRPARNRYPVIWAEAVAPGGAFVWRAEKRNHAPYCEIRPRDAWMVVRRACVLLQRTTAKEQARRLIAAPLPVDFIERHGAVVVENHLNMIRPAVTRPAVSHAVVSAFLNSAAADRAFRCVSGSVAVSAYELEALPLPPPDELEPLRRLIASHAPPATIEAACEDLFRGR